MQSGWIKYGEKWKDISQSKAKIQRKMNLKKNKRLQQKIYIDLRKILQGEKKMNGKK